MEKTEPSIIAVTEVKNPTLKPYFYIFIAQFCYLNLCNYESNKHLEEIFPNQRVSRDINANTNLLGHCTNGCGYFLSRPFLLPRWSEKGALTPLKPMYSVILICAGSQGITDYHLQ